MAGTCVSTKPARYTYLARTMRRSPSVVPPSWTDQPQLGPRPSAGMWCNPWRSNRHKTNHKSNAVEEISAAKAPERRVFQPPHPPPGGCPASLVRSVILSTVCLGRLADVACVLAVNIGLPLRWFRHSAEKTHLAPRTSHLALRTSHFALRTSHYSFESQRKHTDKRHYLRRP